MIESNGLIYFAILLGIILLLSAYLKGTVIYSHIIENFQMHLAQPSKCFSCENQYEDKYKWKAQPSKCFDCEKQSGFKGQPSKCFDCEAQMSK